VEVAFDQAQTPYLTGRGGVVSGVCGEVLAVCGLESVDTSGLLVLCQKGLLVWWVDGVDSTSLRWCRHS
jgi:hypothetical protein